MLSRVHLVERQQALEGEVGVELLYLAAVGHYDPGRTTCGDDLDAVLAQFITGPPDQGVNSAVVAVVEAGLHLRGDHVVGDSEDLGGEVTIGTGETWHDAGDYHRAYLAGAQT